MNDQDLQQAIEKLKDNGVRETMRCTANVAFSLSSGSSRSTGDALKFEDVCARVQGWRPDSSDHVFITECGGWEVHIGKEVRKDRYLFLFQGTSCVVPVARRERERENGLCVCAYGWVRVSVHT
jgi:hypothetical protein